MEKGMENRKKNKKDLFGWKPFELNLNKNGWVMGIVYRIVDMGWKLEFIEKKT